MGHIRTGVLAFGFTASALTVLLAALFVLSHAVGEAWDFGTVVGVWVVLAVIAAIVSAGVSVVDLVEGRRNRDLEDRRRSTTTARVDSDVVHLRTMTGRNLARLRRRHRQRAVVLALGSIAISPIVAVVAGALVYEKEGGFDARELGWTWMAYLALLFGVLAGVLTLVFGLMKATRMLRNAFYVVIGQVLERVGIPDDGLLATTEFERRALTVTVGQCLRVNKRGELGPSDRWSGVETFPGPSELVDAVPDGQIVALLCRHDGRIVERFEAPPASPSVYR